LTCSSIRDSSDGALATEYGRVSPLGAWSCTYCPALNAIGRSQLDAKPTDVRRGVLQLGERPGEVADGVDVHTLVKVDLTLDGQVTPWPGHTDQCRAFVSFAFQQGVRGRVAQVEVTVQHLRLARAAGAVSAGVRQPHALSQAGIEHGLVLAALDLNTERFNGDDVGAHWPASRSRRKAQQRFVPDPEVRQRAAGSAASGSSNSRQSRMVLASKSGSYAAHGPTSCATNSPNGIAFGARKHAAEQNSGLPSQCT